jgi:hypothetical protein
MTSPQKRLSSKRLSLLLICTILIQAQALRVQAETPLRISLNEAGNWQQLHYRGIAANQITYGTKGMLIDVKASASPLILPLNPAVVVSQFDLELHIIGSLNLNTRVGEHQGDKAYDDFLFRLGLVYEGEKTLNLLQRTVAPKWIKQLYLLAPKNSGVDHIEFFTVYSDAALGGQRRQHPLSDLIFERFVIDANDPNYLHIDDMTENMTDSTKENTTGNKEKRIKVSINTDSKQAVIALWLSSDGDDTQSHFQVTVKTLTLHIRAQEK